MKQEEKFARIVELASAAELTAGQAAELDTLLDTDELREVMRSMDDGGDVARRLERYGEYHHVEAFRKFRMAARARRQRRLAGRLAVAGAAAAVLVAVAGLWGRRDLNTARTGIMSATRQAVLISGDDRPILLSERDTTISMGGSQVVISGGELVFDASSQNKDGGASNLNRVVVPRGGVYTVRLPDGSRVMLNAGSELSFPSVFDADGRTVTLGGEGYFEVNADAGRPFTVRTGDGLDVRVLGTKFNVQAYGDMPQTRVTLIEGLVGVGDGVSSVTLVPDEQAVFDRQSGALEHGGVADASTSMAWTKGWFDFNAAPLSVIVNTLEKWYDIDIVADGIDLDAQGSYSIYVNRNGDIANILMALHDISGLNYRVKGRTIYLFF